MLHCLNSTFNTFNSILYTPIPFTLHFTLHAPHSKLHTELNIPHSTLNTSYSILYTPYSLLYTPHSMLHAPLSELNIPQLMLYNLYFVLFTQLIDLEKTIENINLFV